MHLRPKLCSQTVPGCTVQLVPDQLWISEGLWLLQQPFTFTAVTRLQGDESEEDPSSLPGGREGFNRLRGPRGLQADIRGSRGDGGADPAGGDSGLTETRDGPACDKGG